MIAIKKREDIIPESKQVEVDEQTDFIETFSHKETTPEDLSDLEIILDPKKYILSKTDTKGIIEYGNDYFVEISGYKEEELIGKPHSIVRHPDMPKIVFKLLWDRIQQQKQIIAVVKNRAKDGRYYWVMTEFEIKTNKMTNEITGYFAYRKAAPRQAIEKVEPLYAKLLEIEKVSGIEGSHKYLTALLESENKTYDQFIDNILGRGSMMKMWFAAMKKFFG